MTPKDVLERLAASACSPRSCKLGDLLLGHHPAGEFPDAATLALRWYESHDQLEVLVVYNPTTNRFSVRGYDPGAAGTARDHEVTAAVRDRLREILAAAGR